MKEVFETLHGFFSQLGIPVYPENGAPLQGAVLPYLTWTPVQTTPESEDIMTVRIWDESTNYRRAAGLADKLADLIDPDHGVTLPAGAGYIHLSREEPWCQAQPLQDSTTKVLYINIGISTMIP